jgi:hypothetical protein
MVAVCRFVTVAGVMFGIISNFNHMHLCNNKYVDDVPDGHCLLP